MKRFGWALRNFFFPPRCVFCRTPLPLSAKELLCLRCGNTLPYCLAAPRCSRCGKPLAETGAKLCGHCRETPAPAYVRISSPYRYEGTVKEALLRFKHARFQCYATVFAAHMRAVAAYDYGGVTFDWVVSVPPRPERMRRDGYDQAECLAKELARQLKLPYLRNAMRQRENRAKQSGLDYAQRLENVKGNFLAVRPNRLRDKTVLLVDDICTTRATLDACAKALREAGAAQVYCITAATR